MTPEIRLTGFGQPPELATELVKLPRMKRLSERLGPRAGELFPLFLRGNASADEHLGRLRLLVSEVNDVDYGFVEIGPEHHVNPPAMAQRYSAG